MRWLGIVLALGAVGSGCASTGAVGQRAQVVMEADELARSGQAGAARDLYEQVVGEASRDAVHARALYRLALLYVDPSSGLQDHRAAQLAFERLLAEYPNSEWETDARAWRATLVEISVRRADAVRLRSEITRLRGDVLAREAEAARLKDESAKLKADLQRLKRIDLDLERRR
jgi:tetratricopeptide (TPR) repeat protein